MPSKSLVLNFIGNFALRQPGLRGPSACLSACLFALQRGERQALVRGHGTQPILHNHSVMKPVINPDLKAIDFIEALQVCGDRSFAMGNDLLVLDDIATADLEELPKQLGFLLIGLCTSGEAHFTLSGHERCMKPNDLLISLGEQVFRDVTMSDDFHATAVLMSRSYAQDCIVGLSYMWPYLLFVMENPVCHLSDEEQTWITECYSLLRRRLARQEGRYLREGVIALTRAFYFEICNLLDTRAKPDRTAKLNRSYTIFDHFIQLVSQHFKHERSVEWYSSEMCLTPKHLSEVVKAVSGKTAGQWITTMVMTETKTMLQNTTLSIKEIAKEMNFPNQSFLGKYFKNIEGVSPSDFRKQCAGTKP